jgi:hypothetical protein
MRNEKQKRDSKKFADVLRLQLQARIVRERGCFRRVPERAGGVLYDPEEVQQQEQQMSGPKDLIALLT